mmetsp:Transcript_19255/g.53713  ORF Transcript_19255/g.53713 Transcript_19255/m.53713 type:complete len:100 (-) Transcript_19255:245-544(-)
MPDNAANGRCGKRCEGRRVFLESLGMLCCGGREPATNCEPPCRPLGISAAVYRIAAQSRRAKLGCPEAMWSEEVDPDPALKTRVQGARALQLLDAFRHA